MVLDKFDKLAFLKMKPKFYEYDFPTVFKGHWTTLRPGKIVYYSVPHLVRHHKNQSWLNRSIKIQFVQQFVAAITITILWVWRNVSISLANRKWLFCNLSTLQCSSSIINKWQSYIIHVLFFKLQVITSKDVASWSKYITHNKNGEIFQYCQNCCSSLAFVYITQ